MQQRTHSSSACRSVRIALMAGTAGRAPYTEIRRLCVGRAAMSEPHRDGRRGARQSAAGTSQRWEQVSGRRPTMMVKVSRLLGDALRPPTPNNRLHNICSPTNHHHGPVLHTPYLPHQRYRYCDIVYQPVCLRHSYAHSMSHPAALHAHLSAPTSGRSACHVTRPCLPREVAHAASAVRLQRALDVPTDDPHNAY